MIHDQMALGHVIQRDVNVKFAGNAQGGENVIRPMGMSFQRNFFVDHRQQSFQLHIEGPGFFRIFFGGFHLGGITLRLEKLLPQQRCDCHTGHRLLFAVLTIAALGIFAKGDLHGCGILDDHIVYAVAVQLQRHERAAQNVGGAGAGHGGGHAALQRVGEGLAPGIDAVDGPQFRRDRAGIFVRVVALPANAFFVDADVAVRVDKAWRYQTAGSVQYLRALRHIDFRTDRGDFSIVTDEQLAVFDFFAHHGLDLSAAD